MTDQTTNQTTDGRGNLTLADLLKNQTELNSLADELVAAPAAGSRSELQLVVDALGRKLVDAVAEGRSIKLVADKLAKLGPKVRADKLRECVLTALNAGLANVQPRTGKERATYEIALSKLGEDPYGLPRKKDGGKKQDEQPDERLASLQQENAQLKKELDDRADEQPDEQLEILEKEIARLQNELSIASSLQKSLEDENSVLGKQSPVGLLRFYKEGFLDLRKMLVEHKIEIPEALKTNPVISHPPHTPT